jgi:hypothetical protein
LGNRKGESMRPARVVDAAQSDNELGRRAGKRLTTRIGLPLATTRCCAG